MVSGSEEKLRRGENSAWGSLIEGVNVSEWRINANVENGHSCEIY